TDARARNTRHRIDRASCWKWNNQGNGSVGISSVGAPHKQAHHGKRRNTASQPSGYPLRIENKHDDPRREERAAPRTTSRRFLCIQIDGLIRRLKRTALARRLRRPRTERKGYSNRGGNPVTNDSFASEYEFDACNAVANRWPPSP